MVVVLIPHGLQQLYIDFTYGLHLSTAMGLGYVDAVAVGAEGP